MVSYLPEVFWHIGVGDVSWIYCKSFNPRAQMPLSLFSPPRKRQVAVGENGFRICSHLKARACHRLRFCYQAQPQLQPKPNLAKVSSIILMLDAPLAPSVHTRRRAHTIQLRILNIYVKIGITIWSRGYPKSGVLLCLYPKYPKWGTSGVPKSGLTRFLDIFSII